MYDKCVIVGSAPCKNAEYIRKVSEDRFVICTDGGIKNALRAGVVPDLAIGDFDSSDFAAVGDVDTMVLPCEKDVSDMQAAVMHALSKGMKDIALVSCTNGRADHYLANIAMLELVYEEGGVAVIYDEQNKIFLHPTGALSVNSCGYKYLSVIALDREVGPVTISGMKYPLKDAILTRINPLAISNEVISEDACVELCEGRALIILANDMIEGVAQ